MLDSLLSVWTVVYTLGLAFFLFGLTVFVHEFGHFIVAKKCGLKILTFSIGFGKAIWQWKKDGIVYKIGWIPFGGYVALPQLDPEGMERIQGGDPVKCSPISPWKKIAVAVAGPLGNILFAVLLAVVIWLVPGTQAGSQIRPVLGTVETNSAAFASGLRVGDKILAVNGTAVNNWYEFSVETLLQSDETVGLTIRSGESKKELIVPVAEVEGGARIVEGILPVIPCVFGAVTSDSPAERAGLQVGDEVLAFNGVPVLGWDHFTELVQSMEQESSVILLILRGDEQISLSVSPEYDEEYKRLMVGVRMGGGSLPWMLYKNPVDQLKSDALAIVRVVKALSSRDESKQAAKSLGGPVAIFGMLMFSIKTGLLNTLGLIRLININLALLNLLPIPVLDGGHIVFSLWEGVTRRKVNAKVQAVLINFCAILLIGAMLLVTFNDIDRKLHIKQFFGKFFPGQSEVLDEPVSVEGE